MGLRTGKTDLASVYGNGEFRYWSAAFLRQSLKVRPGRKRQAQRHSHPIDELPGMQVAAAANQLQIQTVRTLPDIQNLGGAAGSMHRQKRFPKRFANRPHSRQDMIFLVTGPGNRAVHRGAKRFRQAESGEESRHIGIFQRPGTPRCSNRYNPGFHPDGTTQLLHDNRQVTDVLKNHLRLSQPFAARFHLQRNPAIGDQFSRLIQRSGGCGITAGINPDSHFHLIPAGLAPRIPKFR